MRNGIFPALILFLLVPGPAPVAQALKDETKHALAVDPGSPSRWYAGFDTGIYVSDNGGRDWSSAGLKDHGITDIVIMPSAEGVVYAAAGKDGIFKSSDAGGSWRPVATGGSSALSGQDIRALAVDQSNPSTLYAGTFQGIIYKSLDDGGSWKALNADFPLTALNTLAVHPGDFAILAGTGGRGVLKSSDGGNTWEPLNQGLTDNTVTRLAIKPKDPSTIVAGTYGGGVFITTDGGSNWRESNAGLNNQFVYSLAIAPPVSGKGVSSFLDKMAGKPGAPMIYTGVFGGEIFSGILGERIHWQSTSAVADVAP